MVVDACNAGTIAVCYIYINSRCSKRLFRARIPVVIGIFLDYQTKQFRAKCFCIKMPWQYFLPFDAQDLPFELSSTERASSMKCYRDNFWKTTGMSRRAEEFLSAPTPWFCGKGIVYAFAASPDSGIASDCFDSWNTAVTSPDSPAEGPSGNLTSAFIKAVLGVEAHPGADVPGEIECCPACTECSESAGAVPEEDSILEMYISIHKATMVSNRKFEAALNNPERKFARRLNEKGEVEYWNEHWKCKEFKESYSYLHNQRPILSSTHFCHLNRPLFL